MGQKKWSDLREALKMWNRVNRNSKKQSKWTEIIFCFCRYPRIHIGLN